MHTVSMVSVSSSAVPGMTVAPGQAKVLVAKMPTIPPQLLGAQPSTGLSKALEEDKLPGMENCLLPDWDVFRALCECNCFGVICTYLCRAHCTMVMTVYFGTIWQSP